jgi:hypothetical protein
MPRYTQKELKRRNRIIQSQILIGNFMNKELMNQLVNLFDAKSGDKNEKISKYIMDERTKRGLTNNKIKIKTRVYGFLKNKTTFILEIYKKNIIFLHLSIHIAPDDLNPEKHGMLHIFKNIYAEKDYLKNLYSLIYVNQPHNKPNSLIFSIGDGYITQGIKSKNSYEKEIQTEMDIIITVLNNIFDENNTELYIGKNKDFINIYNKTNNILRNMNRRTKYVTRKNKDKTYFPPIVDVSGTLTEYKYKKKTQRNPSTRKSKIQTRPATENINNNNFNINFF